MNLREMVVYLLDVDMPKEEKQVLRFVLDMNGEGDLEGMLFPEVEAHIRGRFEWFFTPDGNLRRP